MKATKKPVTVEVTQIQVKHKPQWYLDAVESGDIIVNDNDTISIKTLEGTMLGEKDDIIIRGINGEIYPCKPEIFKKTYDVKIDGKLKLYIVEERRKFSNDKWAISQVGLDGYVLLLDGNLIWANLYDSDSYLRYPDDSFDMLEQMFHLNLIPRYMIDDIHRTPYCDPASALEYFEIDYELDGSFFNKPNEFKEYMKETFGQEFKYSGRVKPVEDVDYTGAISMDLFGL